MGSFRETEIDLNIVSFSSFDHAFLSCSEPGEVLDIFLGGRCGAAPHTLTLFKTNIADFPTLFKTEFRFFSD